MKQFNIKKLKPALFMVAISVGVFFVLVAVASQFAEIEKLQNQIKKINIEMWGILLSAAIINFTARGARWHFFAKKLKVNIPISRMALYYVCGFALITTPAKIGTALRLWFIKKFHGYDYAKTSPIMIMDNITDLTAMVILALLGLLAFNYIGVTLFLAVGFLYGIILLLYKPKFILFIIDKANEKLNKPKIFNSLKDVIISTKLLLSPKIFTFTTGLSIFAWWIVSYSFYLLLQQLGAEISLLTVIFIYSCTVILGILSMMPGGIGSTELIMFSLLISVGVPSDIAIVATAVIRLVTLWFAVLLGFICLPFGLRKK